MADLKSFRLATDEALADARERIQRLVADLADETVRGVAQALIAGETVKLSVCERRAWLVSLQVQSTTLERATHG